MNKNLYVERDTKTTINLTLSKGAAWHCSKNPKVIQFSAASEQSIETLDELIAALTEIRRCLPGGQTQIPEVYVPDQRGC